MQADQNDVSDSDSEKMISLQLSISADADATVTIKNEVTGQTRTVTVTAGQLTDVTLYRGSSAPSVSRNHQLNDQDGIVCYSTSSQIVDSSAIHITSTTPISLYAANRRSKSFDATNVLPTTALMDSYIIQTVAPSDHEGKPQGTHFAIVATEDNTVVDYVLTAKSQAWNEYSPIVIGGDSTYATMQLGDTLTTPVLKKGQVFYVWTGKNSGAAADLSGTVVKARDGKKIAIFQGAPHTNLPLEIRDRDHLFSQAVPTPYWGNTFAITASMTRHRDIVAVQALEDGTEVRINGNLVHTFDFSLNPSRTFTFEIGSAGSAFTSKDKNKKDCTLPDPLVMGTSCFIETSCAAATHIFMVSNTYDANPVGDPAMVWVNPIEQRIKHITFGTYGSGNTHYTNIVTDSAGVKSMTLDGSDISADFQPVVGSNNAYYFARKNISFANHTLDNATGFIAHVYGYGSKESYGYSAGGSAIVLEQAITINGEVFSPSKQNTLCGKDNIRFECDLNYDIEHITWYFGDGTSDATDSRSVEHFYANTGVYPAYVIIERSSTNLCAGQLAKDSIPIQVTIGKLEFRVVETVDDICHSRTLTLKYENTGTALTENNTELTLNQVATNNGFAISNLEADFANNQFILTIPADAEQGDQYGFTVDIATGCGDTTVFVPFSVPFDPNKLIAQRWGDVLAVKNNQTISTELGANYQFVAYQWFKNGDTIPGQTGPTLMVDTVKATDEYFVCMTTANGTQICTCPLQLKPYMDTDQLLFDNGITVQPVMGKEESWIYVSTPMEALASVYGVDGQLLRQYELPAGGGNIYFGKGEFGDQHFLLVRVEAGKEKKSFKVFAK